MEIHAGWVGPWGNVPCRCGFVASTQNKRTHLANFDPFSSVSTPSVHRRGAHTGSPGSYVGSQGEAMLHPRSSAVRSGKLSGWCGGAARRGRTVERRGLGELRRWPGELESATVGKGTGVAGRLLGRPAWRSSGRTSRGDVVKAGAVRRRTRRGEKIMPARRRKKRKEKENEDDMWDP